MEQSLLKRGYYGHSDFQPASGLKTLGVYVAVIICSPLILICALLSIIFSHRIKLSNNQQQSLKVILFDLWHKAPGKKFLVEPSGMDTYDILISEELVDDKGDLHSCGGRGISLRKSLEHTVDQHLREGPYSGKITSDTDFNRPRYLLSGSIYDYDPEYDEMWCSSGRICHWPALYSWSPHLPAGLSWSSFTEKISTDDLPEVLGYIHFFELSNPKFYDKDRLVKVGPKAVNCPTITPENEGKLFVRYNYKNAYNFGNIKREEPDAYILKGKTIKDAGVRLVHSYRLMRPPQKRVMELV